MNLEAEQLLERTLDTPELTAEERLDRESMRGECALGVFRYGGPGEISYYAIPAGLQQTQGAFRGGGGRGLVMNAMTHERALGILENAQERPGQLRMYGPTHRVDLAQAQKLEVIQLHCQGRDVDSILQQIGATGVTPLYVETIQTKPGALSFRSYRDTFGDSDPGGVPSTYVRVFINNNTSQSPSQLQQTFHELMPGPVVMSWSSISEETPGLLCYRMAGRDSEFDELFRPDLEQFKATQFLSHSRYPTQQSKPGVLDSQPMVEEDEAGDHIAAMHNGDLANSFVTKQRLRDPHVHKAEREFFARYGKSDVPIKKRPYVHIPAVDSAVVAPLHTYLFDCCKKHGIDPFVISLFERPPSIQQIEAMPSREREFFLRARIAFPELSYQGSAATIVRTDEYIRITPDRTRVLWIARDVHDNVYVASNGGAITNVCAPEDLVEVRPVNASEVVDIDFEGKIRAKGMEFYVPKGGDGHNKRTVFVPGIGFDPRRLDEVHAQSGNGYEAKRKPFEGKEDPKVPPSVSREFGIYGFELADLKRLVKYGDTGTYLATGLGNHEPDGIMRRATLLSQLTSTHQAFIVSPGRDNRIEFSARTLLRNGDKEPLVLRSPVLVSSTLIENQPDGRAVLQKIAEKYGTLALGDLQDSVTIKATYATEEKLQDALHRIVALAENVALNGAQNIIFDDSIQDGEIPIPPSVMSAVVHQHLRRKGVPVEIGGETVFESLRSRVNLIGNFRGVTSVEEIRECVMHGMDAVAPSLVLDGSMGLFTQDLGDNLTEYRSQLIQRGLNALCGLEEDLAIASGSSGFHDINAMRGNAPGMEYELGIDRDLNAAVGHIPGMNAGGIDFKTMDLFLRSRLLQYGADSIMKTRELQDYEGNWERWHSSVLDIVDRMTREGANYRMDPQEYAQIPVVTMEDMVRIKGFENFNDFPDEELRGVDLRILDFVGLMVAHMSIGANNIETWVEILAALYELRHEIQEGKVPFLNEQESLVLAGIGEGGIAAELRLFLSHIMGQYASGRFGLETDDGDIFDRQQLLKEGLLRMKGVKEGVFDESEISEIEKMVARLLKSEHIEKDLASAEDGSLLHLCRFISLVGDKNAQFAKSGYGGMMAKTIMLIARIRGVTPYDVVKSFFNHADGDSVEELRERIFSAMREVAGENPELGDQELGLSSKDALDPYSLPDAFGQVKAGAVMLDHDWRGGTGNRPIGTKRAAHPWMVEAVRYDAMDRQMIGLMTMNWMSSNRTPVEGIRNVLWGHVDGLLIATSLLRAMKCILGRCRECNTGRCAPTLTDQRGERRGRLYVFDTDAPEDPASKVINARMQKDRAKRFILAFLRTMKVLLKNLDAGNMTELKGRRNELEIVENVQVEGADWIRKVTGHPYSVEDVDRACSVSQRFQAGKFIEGEAFPEDKIASALHAYMGLSVEGVPNSEISRNSFLVVGDIANVLPRISEPQRVVFIRFLRDSIVKLEATYRQFLKEKDINFTGKFKRDYLLIRYHQLDHLKDRDEQEFLERLISAYRILELANKFSDDGDEHGYKDQFFARTVHSLDENISIKSPRAIVSQENGFTIDRYRGVQRKIAAAVIEHVRTSAEKKPLHIEISETLTDRDMGILTALNAIYHAMPERFSQTVESIQLHLDKGIAGHNLGAMVNGNYLFGPEYGKIKLNIVVGSPEKPAHVDGSVGMSANGGTITVNGYAGDCAGAYASDLDLAVRGASVKLGMGAKGDTFIYHHEPLSDVAGIGMNGNATIFCPGVRRFGEEARAIAKPGTGGDAQGLAKIVLAASPAEVRKSQIVGAGAQVKKLSRLDKIQIRTAYERYYPLYEKGTTPPTFSSENYSKIVSEVYYRNLVTSILVFDFYRVREDVSFDAQLESAAGEMLESIGIDDSDSANTGILKATMSMLRTLKDQFSAESGELIGRDPDAAFLDARSRALKCLYEFKENLPKTGAPQYTRSSPIS